MRGQLALDGVDPLDEPLNFAFRTAGLVRLRLGREILEFVGIRMRKIERELRARGADELIQNARREDDRFKRRSRAAAKRARAHRGETDRNARLRDQRETEIVPHPLILPGEQAAGERAAVFAENAHEKVSHADPDERHAADGVGGVHERAEIKVEPRPHEKEQQDRRREVVELLEEPLIAGRVDVHHAHGHAAEQRRNIQRRADAAEGEQQRHRDDQAVIRRAPVQKELQQQPEHTAETEHQQIDAERPENGKKIEAPRIRRHSDGDRNAVRYEPHHVVKRNDLQERVDEIALCAGLPDRHHRGGRSGGRGERAEHERKVEIQPEREIAHEKHKRRGETCLQHRDDEHLRPAFLQRGNAEKLAGGKSDKCERDVGEKAHAVDHAARDEIKTERPEQNAGDNVCRDVRQPEL